MAEQVVAARKAEAANPRSRASARLTDLVSRLCRYPIDDVRVGALRYQLLTSWAGTLAEAAHVSQAVFVLQEFRTEERPDDKSSLNGAELARFADAVFGCELPAAAAIPWCVRLPDIAGVDAALRSHVVTDLRHSRLVPRTASD